MVKIGERIKEERIAKQITQQEFADMLGVGRSAVACYEKGRRSPSLSQVVKIADILGVDANYLFGISEKKPTKGFIYILTNPAFKDYVKIGYADDVEARVKQLNHSECTPFAFRIYATYEVSSRLVDKKMHFIIDKLNRNLRSIDEYNGQRREREFFAISPEDAYAIFEAMSEIHDCHGRLQKWESSDEDVKEEELAESIAEEMESKRRSRSANWTFDSWNIPAGATLIHKDNPEIKFIVVDSKNVEYKGEIMSMTRLAKLVSGKESTSHGPGYLSRHFTYNGKLLKDIENI